MAKAWPKEKVMAFWEICRTHSKFPKFAGIPLPPVEVCALRVLDNFKCFISEHNLEQDL